MTSLFTGLSAFPLTPADAAGVVDTEALARLVARLAAAGVDSIGLLGSTGTYAFLDRTERSRAVAAAVEAAAGRVPIVVGVGALRTNWAIELAVAAERLGANGLLMAPVSYTPLMASEVAHHYRAVAAATGLPLAIYNNPGTTNFVFSEDLIADLAGVPGIAAIKMPLPADGDFAAELARLRARTPGDFRIGYSGDWGAAPSLLGGGDAFFSVIGGMLPVPMLALVRAGQAGDVAATLAIDAAFAPLWALFRRWGSLRVLFEIADQIGLRVGEPPLPLRRAEADIGGEVAAALASLEGLC
jgi:4-hydroxy-tetrahydrodipicolinate synthase